MIRQKRVSVYPGGFTAVPNWILDLTTISGSAKSLLIALLRHDFDKSNPVFPGQKRLGKLIGSQRAKGGVYAASPEAVRDATEELIRAGLIVIDGDPSGRRALGRSIHYTVQHDVLHAGKLPEPTALSGTSRVEPTASSGTYLPPQAALTKQTEKEDGRNAVAAASIAASPDSNEPLEYVLFNTKDLPLEAVPPPPWELDVPRDRSLILYEITETMIRLEANPENARAFDKLCNEYGDDRVWRQTRALPLRIAQSGTIINDIAAYLHNAIVKDYSMPKWVDNADWETDFPF